RQDERPAPKVKTNSEKIGYRPRGRKPGKRTDFMTDPAVVARRRQALSQQSAVEQGQP
ncbi:ISNCY family transposase, partial [Sinorhizobium meliloti]